MISAIALSRACKRNGVLPTRFALIVSVAKQTVTLVEKAASASARTMSQSTSNGYAVVESFRCSTSRFGIGQKADSNRTPLGLHRIANKIGGGAPTGTVFKGRRAVGLTWKGMPDAKITTRILWLEGLEPGLNRGGDVDSHARYIYIHGTGDETSVGRPASCGCIHMTAADLVPLFDKLPRGTLVWIAAR